LDQRQSENTVSLLPTPADNQPSQIYVPLPLKASVEPLKTEKAAQSAQSNDQSHVLDSNNAFESANKSMCAVDSVRSCTCKMSPVPLPSVVPHSRLQVSGPASLSIVPALEVEDTVPLIGVGETPAHIHCCHCSRVQVAVSAASQASDSLQIPSVSTVSNPASSSILNPAAGV
jgi:hypothetical protein